MSQATWGNHGNVPGPNSGHGDFQGLKVVPFINALRILTKPTETESELQTVRNPVYYSNLVAIIKNVLKFDKK